MDLASTDVTIRCSRLRAIFLLFVGVPLLTLITLALLAVIATTPFIAKGIGTQNLLTIYLLFPALVVLFSWVVWAMARNREALFTTFVVSASGVTIENTRYGVLLLNWNDITRVAYSKLGKMITLESPKLSKPLSLMSFGGQGGVSPEFAAARQAILAGSQDRWSERWI